MEGETYYRPLLDGVLEARTYLMPPLDGVLLEGGTTHSMVTITEVKITDVLEKSNVLLPLWNYLSELVNISKWKFV